MRGDNIAWAKEILSQAKDIPSVGTNGWGGVGGGRGMQSCLVWTSTNFGTIIKTSIVWSLISKGTFSWF